MIGDPVRGPPDPVRIRVGALHRFGYNEPLGHKILVLHGSWFRVNRAPRRTSVLGLSPPSARLPWTGQVYTDVNDQRGGHFNDGPWRDPTSCSWAIVSFPFSLVIVVVRLPSLEGERGLAA